MRPIIDRLEPKPVAEWTFMIYMAGDNNLSADCVWALTEMKKAARSDNINIIAQFDPSDDHLRTKRFEISESGLRTYEGSTVRKSTGKEATDESADSGKTLDDTVSDQAGFDARTGEVQFAEESGKAKVLAGKRQRETDAKRELAKKLRKEGQFVNVDLPDDSGVASQNDTDTASPITLYNFLSFGVEFYPARHYLVIVSGHSAGVLPNYLLRDNSSGRAMDFSQLRDVFTQLKQDLAGHQDGRAEVIDILGFDTCLMSMAEICCELKDLVQTVIGSETYTPASGWPYRSIVEKISQSIIGADGNPEMMSSRQVASAIVESYVQYYSDYLLGGVSVALSALDVTKGDGLIEVVDDLAKILVGELEAEYAAATKDQRENATHPFMDALLLAHWEAQSYNGELYVDLVDFCECLSKRYPKESVTTACGAVIENARYFVIESAFSGPAYQYSNGCAIYFPWAEVERFYGKFRFAQAFGPFLETYTNLTRRGYRIPKDPTAQQLSQMEEIDATGGNELFRMGSDKMGSDKMGSDKMGSDKMGSDKSGNPIHSMRNPPIVAINLNNQPKNGN